MNKRGIVLYLHVHQPHRLREYPVFDIANRHDYFDDKKNEQIFKKVVEKSYRPMNALLLRMLETQSDFKVSFSITGPFIEQAEKWAPDVLDDFRKLIATGKVDIVSETYYHSLAFFYSLPEFERQIELHRQKVKDTFGCDVSILRNTELSYNDNIAKWADEHGYKGILAEGWDNAIGRRSPDFVYKPVNTSNISLLLKNYKLSDDVAFRFSDKNWSEYPLSADTYVDWLNSEIYGRQIVNLFMDYETFGEHQWADTGIFNFYETFIQKWLEKPDNTFYTLSEAIDTFDPVDEISMPQTVTWADTERDLTAWTGNSIQREALKMVYSLEDEVLRTNNSDFIEDWRKLQISDHFYYMCTKWSNDGDIHAYFSPYNSPYDAFLYFMNALRDLRFRIQMNLFRPSEVQKETEKLAINTSRRLDV